MTFQAKQLVWFITGASTGFGRELAEQLLAAGHKVAVTARKPDQIAEFSDRYPETALALPLDVTDQLSVDNAVSAAIERFGRVDVLINNAGYGINGAVEETTEAEFTPVFETNVFGLIRVTRAFLPHLRQQRSGCIVNLSSIGGLIGSAGWAYYNTTKFAVNGFSEGLAAEMEPLGIHVMVVEPGPFRTDFLSRSAAEAALRIADYDATAGKAREYLRTQGDKQKGDPVRGVKAIIEAVLAPQPPRHLLLGQIALTRFRTRLDQWKTELDTWEAVTVDCDFPDDELPSASIDGKALATK
jgi:NAD(P)-dependent dehydrogenase (short-subunit alcohol dehydrogenase family)